MITITRFLLVCGFIMGATSCGSHLTTYYYLLNTDPELDKAEDSFPLTLDIATVRSPSRYQDRIFYRTGNFEVGFYDHSQWVEFPPDMLKSILVNSLRASDLFLEVGSIGGAGDSDLILRSELGRFDQIVAEEDCFADFELALELMDCASEKMIWSYRASERVKQEEDGEFAAAMNEAVHRAIVKIVAELARSPSLKEIAAGKKEKLKDDDGSGGGR